MGSTPANETMQFFNETFNNVTSFLGRSEEVVSIDEVDSGLCGANFCPVDVSKLAIPNLKPPEPYKIHLIAGIYLGCMIAACLVVAFGVDSMKRYSRGRKGSGSGLSGFKLLAVTLKHLANPYQILILPITMFIGAEQAFIAADFNVAFVSCGWGISNIGFVMVCFGLCNAITAIFVGSIIKITGRSPVICCALSLHVALIVTMLIWQPRSDNPVLFFIVASLWGIADAVWLVQINSLSGILFPGREEAAYSNFRLWESTGSVITYAYSSYLCTDLKLYLLLGLLLIGAAGYTAVEYLQYKKKIKQSMKKRPKVELLSNSSNAEAMD